MTKNIFIALAFLATGVLAQASELGSNSGRNSQTPRTSSSSRPSISDSNQASRQSGTSNLRQDNTGAGSLNVVMKTITDAAKVCTSGEWNKLKKVCTNVLYTTQHAGQQVTNISACKIIKAHVNASCYGGTKDYFFNGRPTASGMTYSSKLQTAAFPSRSELGNILVVSYQGKNRAITATDIGPAKSLQRAPKNRGIDLSAEAFHAFGGRCDFDPPMKDVSIYSCPVTTVPASKAVANR